MKQYILLLAVILAGCEFAPKEQTAEEVVNEPPTIIEVTEVDGGFIVGKDLEEHKRLLVVVEERQYVSSISSTGYSVNGSNIEKPYNVLILLDTSAESYADRAKSAKTKALMMTLIPGMEQDPVLDFIRNFDGEDYELVEKLIRNVFTCQTLIRLKQQGGGIYERYRYADYETEKAYCSTLDPTKTPELKELWRSLYIPGVDVNFKSGIKELKK